jgi:[ribosomal protein S5]-alanine N-acetyltransferase
VLRELIPADATDLFLIHGSSERMKWFGTDPLKDEEAAANLIATFASWRSMPSPGTRWALQHRGETSLLGTCGLFAWNPTWKKCIVGFELKAAAEGKGLMREALECCISWGFDAMDLNRIEAQVHPMNERSLRLLEGLGFVSEGTLRQLGFWGGKFHDMVQLALLRADWRAREAQQITRADA